MDADEVLNWMAMQQGGRGLLMTLFLVNVPPMVAAFFQGTVGQFMAYNAFGQGQAMQPTRPGGPYAPAPAPGPNTGAAETATQIPQRNYG